MNKGLSAKWWLFAFAGCSLVIPFGLYLYYFHGFPPALRGTLEEWALLGGFLSGTAGTLIGVANVYAVWFVANQVNQWGRASTQKAMAATILSEWSVPHLLNARLESAKFIGQMRRAKSESPKAGEPFNLVNQWMDDGRLVELPFLSYDSSAKEKMQSLHLVASYFERVAILAERDYISRDDIRQLIGANWVWWHHYAFRYWPDEWENVRERHVILHEIIAGTADYNKAANTSVDYQTWLVRAHRQVPI